MNRERPTDRDGIDWTTGEPLTPEQIAEVEQLKKELATPENREREAREIEAFMAEVPPKAGTPADLIMRFGAEVGELLATLRLERERQGLSLTDLSQRTGMDRGAISKLERGRTNPTVETLTKYAGALGKALRLELVDAR